jgi:hypothetical protein
MLGHASTSVPSTEKWSSDSNAPVEDPEERSVGASIGMHALELRNVIAALPTTVRNRAFCGGSVEHGEKLFECLVGLRIPMTPAGSPI